MVQEISKTFLKLKRDNKKKKNINKGDEGLSAYIRCQIHVIPHNLVVFLMEVN